jgi:hypothetical protein
MNTLINLDYRRMWDSEYARRLKALGKMDRDIIECFPNGALAQRLRRDTHESVEHQLALLDLLLHP